MGEKVFKITENKNSDGWCEVGIRHPEKGLLAVVSRQIKGGKWFLHRMGVFQSERFDTKKAAINKFIEENTA